MLAIIAAVAFGISFGGLIGAIVTGDWIYTIVASIAFAIACITGVFAGIWTFTRGIRSATPGLTMPGDPALARVESIRRTGFSVNDQPQVELTLTVAPTHRAAYRTVHRQIVDIVALPQVQPGSVIVVRRAEHDQPNVLIEFNPPPDWAGLCDTADAVVGGQQHERSGCREHPGPEQALPRVAGRPRCARERLRLRRPRGGLLGERHGALVARAQPLGVAGASPVGQWVEVEEHVRLVRVGPTNDDDRPRLHLRQRHDVDDLAVHRRVGGPRARRDGERQFDLRLVVHAESRAPDALHASERHLPRHRQTIIG